jgi:hypothetical protein
LLRAHPQYQRSFLAARAAAGQWELVEPVNPVNPINPSAAPIQPPWMQFGLATQHPWMAFDNSTGLPNELLAEQLLATDLGAKVENQEMPKEISLVRLEELFRPVLNKDSIDQSRPADRQLTAFFETNASYIAITQGGNYSALVSKLTVLNAVVRGVVEKKQDGDSQARKSF